MVIILKISRGRRSCGSFLRKSLNIKCSRVGAGPVWRRGHWGTIRSANPEQNRPQAGQTGLGKYLLFAFSEVNAPNKDTEKHVVPVLVGLSQVPPHISTATTAPPYLFPGDRVSLDRLLPAYPLVPSASSMQRPERSLCNTSLITSSPASHRTGIGIRVPMSPCGVWPCLPLQPPLCLSPPCCHAPARWPSLSLQIGSQSLHTCCSLYLANSYASSGLSLNVTFSNYPFLTLI